MVYTYMHCICIVYLFTSHREGGNGEGAGVESERRLEGQQFTKLGQKYQMTKCVSVCKLG
jgi:hypothetical protein